MLRFLHAKESSEAGNSRRICLGALEWLARNRRENKKRPQSHNSLYSSIRFRIWALHFYRPNEQETSSLGQSLLAGRLTPVQSLFYHCLFMSNDLTLYSRDMCSWCIDAKDFLQARGYTFTEVDVGRNRAAYEEMKGLSDQSYVPTLVAGEEVLANFDVHQLEKFLDQHQIEP